MTPDPDEQARHEQAMRELAALAFDPNSLDRTEPCPGWWGGHESPAEPKPVEITDEMVERGCRGVWPHTWPNVPNPEGLRQTIRAALSAALSPAEPVQATQTSRDDEDDSKLAPAAVPRRDEPTDCEIARAQTVNLDASVTGPGRAGISDREKVLLARDAERADVADGSYRGRREPMTPRAAADMEAIEPDEWEAIWYAFDQGYRNLDDGFSEPRDSNRAVLQEARRKLEIVHAALSEARTEGGESR